MLELKSCFVTDIYNAVSSLFIDSDSLQPTQFTVEELRLRVVRQSPSIELIEPSIWFWGELSNMICSLSASECLTVLYLSGQNAINPDIFVESRPDQSYQPRGHWFPALTTFYLGISADTEDGVWFFIRDEAEGAWKHAAEDLPSSACAEETAEEEYPDDIYISDDEKVLGECEMSSAKHDLNRVLGRPPVCMQWRGRTLPNDETMEPLLCGAAHAVADMKRIQTFSICLEDNFSKDKCEHTFTSPSLSRKFELHFVKPPLPKAATDAGRPTLTWKLGRTHWRPSEKVLEEWKAAVGPDSDLGVIFAE